jgi:RNA polymerase sigma factor (sigma-70 family)
MAEPSGGHAQSSVPSFAAVRPFVHTSAASRSVTEPAEFNAFFRLEFAPVLRAVELILRDHARAEEITQDAFVQLLRHWPKVSTYERPGAWVRRVAIRLAVRSLRREDLWRSVRAALIPAAAPPSSRYDLDGAIRQLSGSQRAAIVLHYYEDRPTAEVATLLGCSESTARVHLHHARKRLAAILGEDDRGA